jgi:RNase P/RNase MRP subunit POP5
MQEDRWRYILLKIVSEGSFSEADLMSALTEAARRLFGLVGLYRTSPKITRFLSSSGYAIVKCRAGSVEEFRAVVALLGSIGGRPAAAFVIRSSGTIKALTRGLISR